MYLFSNILEFTFSYIFLLHISLLLTLSIINMNNHKKNFKNYIKLFFILLVSKTYKKLYIQFWNKDRQYQSVNKSIENTNIIIVWGKFKTTIWLFVFDWQQNRFSQKRNCFWVKISCYSNFFFIQLLRKVVAFFIFLISNVPIIYWDF